MFKSSYGFERILDFFLIFKERKCKNFRQATPSARVKLHTYCKLHKFISAMNFSRKKKKTAKRNPASISCKIHKSLGKSYICGFSAASLANTQGQTDFAWSSGLLYRSAKNKRATSRKPNYPVVYDYDTLFSSFILFIIKSLL